MYQRKPKVIWIDGIRFSAGLMCVVSSGILFSAVRAFWDTSLQLPLFIAAVMLALVGVALLWRAWVVGRQRKANYDARPNKVLPRGSRSNADVNY